MGNNVTDPKLQDDHIDLLHEIEPTMRDAFQNALLMDIDHDTMVGMVIDSEKNRDINIRIMSEESATRSLIANGYQHSADVLFSSKVDKDEFRVVVITDAGVSVMVRSRSGLMISNSPAN